MNSALDFRVAAAVAGVVLVVVALWAIRRLGDARQWGAPVAFDDGRSHARTLVSPDLGLAGRPDEIWRLPDGRSIPVEIKSRSAPRGGVFASHRVQVEAYCWLIEATSGRSPPYGVVAYADGESRKVRWDAAARNEVAALRSEILQPYDGRATPSPGKCRACRWRLGCDARSE